MAADIRLGDARDVLRDMPEASVHCVVTSPPYWSLRAYGGDPGMIGLEPTFEEHLENLLAVFREVRRVLRPDGTLWLNYGDCYARGDKRGSSGTGDKQASNRGSAEARGARLPTGFKPKDLMMMPARVAMALQADGWWLRSEIVIEKSNPMPESAKDRPTRAHEFVFLMTPALRYFYDAEAVKEPVAGTAHARASTRAHDSIEARKARANPDASHTSTSERRGIRPHTPKDVDGRSARLGRAPGWREPGVTPKSAPPGSGIRQNESFEAALIDVPATRNLRDVWTFSSAPFRGAHFATFPPALVEPCIRAGTSERGCCAGCGAPWVRTTERMDQGWDESRYGERAVAVSTSSGGTARSTLGSSNGKLTGKTKTMGWRPTCDCYDEGYRAEHPKPRRARKRRRHLPQRRRHHPPRRCHPAGTERRMGRPESPLHDPRIHRAGERQCPRQAATRGRLSVPAQSAGSRVERNALTPRHAPSVLTN